MAECFNPVVRTSGSTGSRPDRASKLLDPAAGAPFARKFMCEEQYYREDQAHPLSSDLSQAGQAFSGRTACRQGRIQSAGVSAARLLEHLYVEGCASRLSGSLERAGADAVPLPGQAERSLGAHSSEFAESLKPQVQHLRAYPMLSLSHRLGRWHRGAGGGRVCSCECSWRGGSAAARAGIPWRGGIHCPWIAFSGIA